jgi:hypothetical protein
MFTWTQKDLYERGVNIAPTGFKVVIKKNVMYILADKKIVKPLNLPKTLHELTEVPYEYLGSIESLNSYLRGVVGCQLPEKLLYPYILQTLKVLVPPYIRGPEYIVAPWRFQLVRNILGFRTYHFIISDSLYYFEGYNTKYNFEAYQLHTIHPNDKGFLRLCNDLSKPLSNQLSKG